MALQQPMLNDKWLETPICLNILISLIIAIHVILIEVELWRFVSLNKMLDKQGYGFIIMCAWFVVDSKPSSPTRWKEQYKLISNWNMFPVSI